MPELRVVIPKGLNELLDEIINVGLFATKADAIRASIIYFLKDLGWLEKPLVTDWQKKTLEKTELEIAALSRRTRRPI